MSPGWRMRTRSAYETGVVMEMRAFGSFECQVFMSSVWVRRRFGCALALTCAGDQYSSNTQGLSFGKAEER